MFGSNSNLFQSVENEIIFKELCENMKNHPFESPWKNLCPESQENQTLCGVQEIHLPESFDAFIISSNKSEDQKKDILLDVTVHKPEEDTCDDFEKKFLILKESLLTIQESSTTDHIKEIEILSTVCLSQVPEVCSALQNALVNQNALSLFLSAVLELRTPLSLYITTALVNLIIYPQVFETNENPSRNLIAAVLNFSEEYPKSVIDGMIIPCLNQPVLKTLQLETLLKITKSSLPGECVSYCLRNILEQALPTENVFCILQNLIERKINLTQSMHETLAWAMENWSATCKQNVKFTKLIISVLTTYGTELKEQEMAAYRDIIEKNETLMKKAAENVFKKLKKNTK